MRRRTASHRAAQSRPKLALGSRRFGRAASFIAMRRYPFALLAALLGACATGATSTPREPAPSARPSAAPPTRLRIISINDFHGAFDPRVETDGVRRGGAAYLASAIRQARAECPAPCATVVLDGGDLFQGTVTSNLAYGRPVVQLYEHLDVSATALGNHEFDWGIDSLRARMREAPFAILGANVRDASGQRPSWVRADTIVQRDGLRIGIVGVATPETPQVSRAENIRGLTFLEPAPIVDAHARSLRARGADVVIVVAHMGAFCDRMPDATCRGEVVDLASAVTERIDAIVSGHSHSLVNTVVNGVPIVQAGSSGRTIAVMDLEPAGEGWRPTAQLRSVYADSLEADSTVAALVSAASAQVAAVVQRRIGQNAARLSRTGAQYPLGNLVADAQRWAGQADIAVMNNGGIRADLVAGDVSFGQLYEIQPFGNRLVRLTVTGTTLLSYLESIVGGERLRAHVSGVRVRFDPVAPEGSRVVEARLGDGRPIVPGASYTVVLNDFLAEGGDGLALGREAQRTEQLGVIDLDALIAYIQAHPQPFTAPDELRLIPTGL